MLFRFLCADLVASQAQDLIHIKKHNISRNPKVRVKKACYTNPLAKARLTIYRRMHIAARQIFTRDVHRIHVSEFHKKRK